MDMSAGLFGIQGGQNISQFGYRDATFTNRAVSSADFSFATRAIGTAHPERIVVVTVNGLVSTGTVGACTAVTIGGIAATQIVTNHASNDVRQSLTAWAALVPTGTTATIGVTHGSALACGIGVWSFQSRSGKLQPSVINSIANDGAGANPHDVSLAGMAAGGCIIAASIGINDVDPVWTGLTERFAVDINTTEYHSGADLALTVGASLSITRTTAAADNGTFSAFWS